jgi:hypothetical protein
VVFKEIGVDKSGSGEAKWWAVVNTKIYLRILQNTGKFMSSVLLQTSQEELCPRSLYNKYSNSTEWSF